MFMGQGVEGERGRWSIME
jgi:hypothetical protein